MKKLAFMFLSALIVFAMIAGCAPAAAPAAEAPEAPAAEAPEAPAAEAPEAPAAEAPEAPAAEAQQYTFATVVKLIGVGWFNRMEVGVKDFGNDYPNVTTFQQGPAKADAALQVQVLEDLIAQKVDAIGVVPFQPEAVEPVLKKAREQGIVVISHEASNQENIDYDIEAFDNAAYGVHFMDKLAELMGGEGEYVVMVGSLTSKTHNEWVDAAIAHQKEKYPNMKLMGDKNESYDDAQKAYEKGKELLKKYPNLKGFQGSSANDVVGFGQAVEEAGLNGKVFVVGTSIPSMVGTLIESGAVQMASAWDPALAGYAMNKLALMIKEGRQDEIKDGMDLGVKGYNNIKLDGKVLYGAAWLDFTKENVKDYDF